MGQRLKTGHSLVPSYRCLPALVTLAIAGHGVGAEPAAEAWRVIIAPYLLVPSISGEAGLGRLDAAPVEVDSEFIFGHLKAGFMMRAEIGHGRWSLLLDGAYMDLEADGDGSGGRDAELAFTQLITEVDLAYRCGSPAAWVDFLVGARAWGLTMEGRFTGPLATGKRSMDADWIDPIIGLRAAKELNAAWALTGRFDLGGFGVGADSTWQLELGVAWQATSRLAVTGGYRALDVDYADGDRGEDGWFRYDVLTHGPQVGVSWTF